MLILKAALGDITAQIFVKSDKETLTTQNCYNLPQELDLEVQS